MKLDESQMLNGANSLKKRLAQLEVLTISTEETLKYSEPHHPRQKILRLVPKFRPIVILKRIQPKEH